MEGVVILLVPGGGEGSRRLVLICALLLLSFSMSLSFRVVRGGWWVFLLILKVELLDVMPVEVEFLELEQMRGQRWEWALRLGVEKRFPMSKRHLSAAQENVWGVEVQ